MPEQPVNLYQVPSSWLTFATEELSDVMSAVAFLLQQVSSIDEEENSIVTQTLALYAQKTIEGWKIERTFLGDGDMEVIVITAGAHKFLLCGFPLELVEIGIVADKMAALRKRVVES